MLSDQVSKQGNHNAFQNSFLIIAFIATSLFTTSALADVLPSWKDSPSKQAIVAFVKDVTNKESKRYAAPAERIATFDNDGTLWSEQPAYFQLIFAFDQIEKLAPKHPEWKTEEPYASVLKKDYKKALAGGTESLMKLIFASHANMTTEEFSASARQWLATARHPKTKKLYKEMIFQPMLELLDYLRQHEFKTFIVSGGGIDFLRVFAEEAYGIPPEQVVGTSLEAKYEVIDGVPTITKQPGLHLLDDKEGKPIGIHQHIGRRPIMAVGNSDGDYQMIEWTTAGPGARLGVFIHHTDDRREWAYDRDSHIGQFDKGLDDAKKKGWVVVDMKKDWAVIYP